MLTLPRVFALDERTRTGDPIRQLGDKPSRQSGSLIPYQHAQLRGLLFRPDDGSEDILFVPKNVKRLPDGYPRILLATLNLAERTADLTNASWLKHPLMA